MGARPPTGNPGSATAIMCKNMRCWKFNINAANYIRYLTNTYVRYLSYALLIIAELPNDELTGNHTLSLPPLYL